MRKEWYELLRNIFFLLVLPSYFMEVSGRPDKIKGDMDVTMTPEGLSDVREVVVGFRCYYTVSGAHLALRNNVI